MTARYAYGDSAIAAERLDLIARVFEPTTRRFLERWGLSEPALAVDLGCGPGNTTRLLAETLRPARTVGLDRSGAFLERAARDAPGGLEFLRHDVTATPFPVGPADVISCRLLLSHVPERPKVVARWASQLAPGGRLLLEELEVVRSKEPAFARYLEIVQRVVADAGGRLFVGAELDAMPDPAGLSRAASDVVILDVEPADAATIFAMNVAVLTQRGEIAPDPELTGELAAIAERHQAAETSWSVRQLAFERTEGFPQGAVALR